MSKVLMDTKRLPVKTWSPYMNQLTLTSKQAKASAGLFAGIAS